MDDRNAPATKGDIVDLDQKLEQFRSETNHQIEQLRSENRENLEQLRSEVNHGYADIVERMSDGETRLLRAFYDFATSNQKRMTEVEANEALMRSRLATLEDRILQVEKRLNMPPAA
jgi:hypothetical protein